MQTQGVRRWIRFALGGAWVSVAAVALAGTKATGSTVVAAAPSTPDAATLARETARSANAAVAARDRVSKALARLPVAEAKRRALEATLSTQRKEFQQQVKAGAAATKRAESLVKSDPLQRLEALRTSVAAYAAAAAASPSLRADAAAWRTIESELETEVIEAQKLVQAAKDAAKAAAATGKALQTQAQKLPAASPERASSARAVDEVKQAQAAAVDAQKAGLKIASMVGGTPNSWTAKRAAAQKADDAVQADTTLASNAVVSANAALQAGLQALSTYPGTAPSCQRLRKTCGPRRNEDCCVSLPVEGGAFLENVDNVSLKPKPKAKPTNVLDFRLDKFEITHGRFGAFVDAWVGGWRPAKGAGKHSQLNHGAGAKFGAKSEAGWEVRFNERLPNDRPTWNKELSCTVDPWPPQPGTENVAMNCLSWYDAYAFCIWDGGFLPTTAELNYADSGGSEQRLYPWSVPPTFNGLDCAHARYGNCPEPRGPIAVGMSPAGNGRWGQADLAGNVNEWMLDPIAYQDSPNCTDCPGPPPYRVLHDARGGAWDDGEWAPGQSHLSAARTTGGATQSERDPMFGGRCARPL